MRRCRELAKSGERRADAGRRTAWADAPRDVGSDQARGEEDIVGGLDRAAGDVPFPPPRRLFASTNSVGRGDRFALWALLHLLGSAPDLDVAFKDEADRDAARNFMDLLAAAGAG